MGLTCIYCPNPPDAREHWFPRAFGNFKGYTPLLNRLCQRCNVALGHTLDEPLIRTGPTAFRREVLGIRGRKKHRKVNPFHWGVSAKEPPNTLLIPADDGRGHLLADVAHKGAIKPLRQLVVTHEGTRPCVPFLPQWTAEHIRNQLHTRGLVGAELQEIHLDPGEDPHSRDMRLLLSAVFGRFEATVFLPKKESEFGQVRLKSVVSEEYFRATAKVAFHYTLWAVPRLTGYEPGLEPLKRYIRWGAGEFRHFVQPLALQMLKDLNRWEMPQGTHHLLTAFVHETGASAAVRFFADPKHALPPSLVELSKSPHFEQPHICGHLLHYFEEPQDGYNGEITAIPVTLL